MACQSLGRVTAVTLRDSSLLGPVRDACACLRGRLCLGMSMVAGLCRVFVPLIRNRNLAGAAVQCRTWSPRQPSRVMPWRGRDNVRLTCWVTWDARVWSRLFMYVCCAPIRCCKKNHELCVKMITCEVVAMVSHALGLCSHMHRTALDACAPICELQGFDFSRWTPPATVLMRIAIPFSYEYIHATRLATQLWPLQYRTYCMELVGKQSQR